MPSFRAMGTPCAGGPQEYSIPCSNTMFNVSTHPDMDCYQSATQIAAAITHCLKPSLGVNRTLFVGTAAQRQKRSLLSAAFEAFYRCPSVT